MNNLSLKPIYPRQITFRHGYHHQIIPSPSVSCLAHELSVEQQLYFQMLTETCFNGTEEERTNAFRSLSSDASLQPLLPRFLLFIHHGILTNIALRDLLFVIRFLSILKMLTINKHLAFDKYLSLILPVLLTCSMCVFDLPKAVLQPSPGEKPPSTCFSTIWILREQASDLLTYFRQRYARIARLTERLISILKTHLMGNSMNITYSVAYACLRTLVAISNPDTKQSIHELLGTYSLNEKLDADFDLDPMEQQILFREKINDLVQKYKTL